MAERLTTVVSVFAVDRLTLPAMTWATRVQHFVDETNETVRMVRDEYDEFPVSESSPYFILEPVEVAQLRQWRGFDVECDHVKDETNTVVTSIGFRLFDGTNQWRWTGAAWTQTTTGWNTEQEIVDHIGTFAITTRKLAPVVHLETADNRYSPTFRRILVAFDAHLTSSIEDLWLDTFKPLLETSIRPVGELGAAEFEGGAALALAPLLDAQRGRYADESVLAVYNIDADPNRRTNLLSAYDSGSQVATLTAAQDACRLAALVQYAPPVVVWKRDPDDKDEDGDGLKRLPLMWISQTQGSTPRRLTDPILVRNKGALSALMIPPPTEQTFTCVMMVLAQSGVDEARLAAEIADFFQENPIIRSNGTGERYRVQLVSGFEEQTEDASPGNERAFTAQFVVHHVLNFHGPATTVPLVGSFTVRMAG